MRSTRRSLLLASSLVLAVFAAASWMAAARAVEPVPVAGGRSRPIAQPVTPPGGDAAQAPGDANGRVAQLNLQIKALRDEYHGKLDPLQAQVKALRDQYDPQIKGLEDQRHAAVEAGKPQAIQDLDRQEDTELAALADKEKAQHEQVKQDFAQQRKDVQGRYAKLRQQAGGK